MRQPLFETVFNYGTRGGRRIFQSQIAGWVVRGINHGRNIIDLVEGIGQTLADRQAVVALHHETEHVDRDPSRLRRQFLVQKPKKIMQNFIIGPGAIGKNRPRKIPVGRETHVIKVYLVKTQPDGLGGYRRVIAPDLFVSRVNPGQTGPIPPNSARRVSYRHFRVPLGQPRILEDGLARDDVNAVLMEFLYYRLQIFYNNTFRPIALNHIQIAVIEYLA